MLLNSLLLVLLLLGIDHIFFIFDCNLMHLHTLRMCGVVCVHIHRTEHSIKYKLNIKV